MNKKPNKELVKAIAEQIIKIEKKAINENVKVNHSKVVEQIENLFLEYMKQYENIKS
jgi:hypothetical protein